MCRPVSGRSTKQSHCCNTFEHSKQHLAGQLAHACAHEEAAVRRLGQRRVQHGVEALRGRDGVATCGT